VLTVQALVDDLDLPLSAGEHAADVPIRWVHITELLDPTRWLSGGELLLTTGLQLESPDEQRRFVRRLVDHHLAGLGFGTGFGHAQNPDALLAEARRLNFPLFEVPYEMPFIAITENAFGRLVNEQYETLQRGIAIHKRLEQLVLDERGLEELVSALAAAIGGAAVVLDRRGETMALCEFRRALSREALDDVRHQVGTRSDSGHAVPFAPDHAELAGRALALPVGVGERPGPEAWLLAVRDSGGLADFERLILHQAVTVVALELMRTRVVRETERRLAGDVLEEALSGELNDHEIASRLRPFGVGSQLAVLLFDVRDETAAEPALDRALAGMGIGALVAARDGRLCAVTDAAGFDPVELARSARTALDGRYGNVRAAASRVAPVGSLSRSYHEARCALDLALMSNGSSLDVSSYRDLGAFQFLLSVQDDEALRVYCDSVLGPIEQGEGEYGNELIRSLEAFLEHNGQWEKAARHLYCHRHTLRYRIRRVEELTGRDLGRAHDRIEFWLALHARELVP
jgi:purine catabolism regulator